MEKDKQLRNEAPFKLVSHGEKPFNPDKTVFGEKNDKNKPLVIPQKRRSYSEFKHETSFKPSSFPKEG